MLGLTFDTDSDTGLQILCLGAHSDDIEIGCGGTIMNLIEEYARSEIHWIVFGSKGERTEEAHQSANAFLAKAVKKNIIVKEFRDSFFPYFGAQIKEFFEEIKQQVEPDIIFTHYRHDLHQDHRLLSELTWNTFRDHLILEYEVPKYDGDIGIPNFFVHLDEETCRRKIEYVLTYFKSQQNRDWFTWDTFSSLMRLRGMESRSVDKYAEAFYCRKIVVRKR